MQLWNDFSHVTSEFKMWKSCDFELCHFLPVLSCVIGVFNSPVVTPLDGLLGLNLSLRLRFISENPSLLALYICATTHGLTSLSC